MMDDPYAAALRTYSLLLDLALPLMCTYNISVVQLNSKKAGDSTPPLRDRYACTKESQESGVDVEGIAEELWSVKCVLRTDYKRVWHAAV